MKMMKNENVKTTVKNEKVWKPNDNQKAFLTVLEGYNYPVTLMEIEVDTGVRYASGIATALVKRGLVISEDTQIVCDIVFKGVKVGEKTNSVKAYTLVKETE